MLLRTEKLCMFSKHVLPPPPLFLFTRLCSPKALIIGRNIRLFVNAYFIFGYSSMHIFTEFGKVSESDMVTNEANRRWGKAFLTGYVKDAENHGRHVTVTG